MPPLDMSWIPITISNPTHYSIFRTTKRLKYAEHYQQHRLAFAPIVANTLGQFGADTLQFLWNLADYLAQSTFGFSIDSPANKVFRLRPPLPNKKMTTDAFEISNTMKIVFGS
jgi:hypothetical protein